MAKGSWQTKTLAVASLHLDAKNPRLGRETLSRAPREIIQYLFEHDKALEVAESIATRGFFPNEPLLAIREDGRYVVVEGNRRLAALKALREPGLLEGHFQRKVARQSRQIADPQSIANVPVVIATSRRLTDRQVVGRHIGSPVLAWEAENRASFILDKLKEGYDNDELRDVLGFSLSHIQQARQTRAIADMARSIELPDEVKAKLDGPRAKIFTTLGRVFDSTIGRDFLQVEPDSDHGIRGTTTKKQFVRGFTKLVTDVALGKATSRTLNTNENIRAYFESWGPKDRPEKKRGSFVPSEIIKGKSVASHSGKPPVASPKKSKQICKTVLPKNFKVRFGSDRLIDIRRELTKLKRDDFPNAGAIVLRVFLELAVVDYLERIGELPNIIEKIEKRQHGRKLPFGVPTMRQLVPTMKQIARRQLPDGDFRKVDKALHYDPSAPFTISDLHGFVHSSDLPSERDIQQFWLRTESLFRMMLEEDSGDVSK